MQTQQNPRIARAAWYAVAQDAVLHAGLSRLAAVGLAIVTLLALSGHDALAQYTLSQQGRLLSSGDHAVPPGLHQFTVKFYTVQSGGSAIAGVTPTVVTTNVANGVFTVPIAIANATEMSKFVEALPSWVGVQIDSDSELPRIPLRDVPFALIARKALALTCSGCVSSGEITDATIVNGDMAGATAFGSVQNNLGTEQFPIRNDNKALRFAAGSAKATVTFDAPSHTVTIDAPGAAGGTVTSITAGAGLSGGTITSSGTIAIPTGGVDNTMLKNSTITVSPGTGITVTGSPVALGNGLAGAPAVTISNNGVVGLTATSPLANNGTASNPIVAISKTLAGLTTGHVIRYDGANWVNAFINSADLATTVPTGKGGTGITTAPTAAGQYLRSTAANVWGINTIQPADIPANTGNVGNYVDKTTAQNNIGGAKTWTAAAVFSAAATFNGNILLGNTGSNLLSFANTAPTAVGPALNATTGNTKVVFFPSAGSGTTNHAMGIESGPPNALWYSIPAATASYAHKWYGGVTQLMLLSGNGALTVLGTVTAPSFVGAHSGNGSGLTNLNPTKLTAGTAAINISGNAATASTATSATNATNAQNAVNATFATSAGNATTVNNGVYTTNSYGDSNSTLPFITNVAGSKITGTVASAATANSATSATSFTGVLGGDVTGNQGSTYVAKLANIPLNYSGLAVGTVLKYNSSGQWQPQADSGNSGSDVQGSGSGAANYHAKWSNSTTLTNSMISDNGSVASISGNGYMRFGPNSSWGQYLNIGGNGPMTNDATVATTDGNLHLDALAGHPIYLNWYRNTDVKIGNGNLTFNAANPSIVTNGSYFQVPYGAYFYGGTVYISNAIQARGGVQNDSGELTLNDNVNATGQGSTSMYYYDAPIEILQNSSAPRIGFHWPGVVASQIGMDSGGVIRTYNNPGTGYENFAAYNVTAYGSVRGRGTSYGWRLGSPAGDGVSSANPWLYLMRDDGGGTYHDLAVGVLHAGNGLQLPATVDYSGNNIAWVYGAYSTDYNVRKWSLSNAATQMRNPTYTDGYGRSIAGAIQVGQNDGGCGCTDANRGVLQWRSGGNGVGSGNDTLWICMRRVNSGYAAGASFNWIQML